MFNIDDIRTDGGTQPRESMDHELIGEYADAMESGSKFPPVHLVKDGDNLWLVDGFHRVAAARLLERSVIDARIVAEGGIEKARWLSLQANSKHGKRRTRADKQRAVRHAIRQFHEATPQQRIEFAGQDAYSDRFIADHVGVDHKTVGKHRKEVLASGEIPQTPVTRGADGVERNTANIGGFDEGTEQRIREEVERQPDASHREIARRVGVGHEAVARRRDEDGRIKVEARKPVSLVAANSANGADGNEWYTPREYIEAAFEMMGGIDLDPASCEVAWGPVDDIVDSIYTIEDDALTKDWNGRVWLNPPYSYPEIEHFVEKLIAEYEAGRVEKAVIITNNCTDTGWFHRLLQFPMCLLSRRVKFWRQNQETFATRQGQAVFALGVSAQELNESFGKYGVVMEAV